jgi:hypothetical protein
VALCNSVGIAEFNEQYVAMVVSTPSLALEICYNATDRLKFVLLRVRTETLNIYLELKINIHVYLH